MFNKKNILVLFPFLLGAFFYSSCSFAVTKQQAYDQCKTCKTNPTACIGYNNGPYACYDLTQSVPYPANAFRMSYATGCNQPWSSCPNVNTFSFTGTYPTCGTGQTYSPDTASCNCPSGQVFDGTSCHVECAAGTTWNGTSCSSNCSENSEPFTYWDGSACVSYSDCTKYTGIPGTQYICSPSLAGCVDRFTYQGQIMDETVHDLQSCDDHGGDEETYLTQQDNAAESNATQATQAATQAAAAAAAKQDAADAATASAAAAQSAYDTTVANPNSTAQQIAQATQSLADALAQQAAAVTGNTNSQAGSSAAGTAAAQASAISDSIPSGDLAADSAGAVQTYDLLADALQGLADAVAGSGTNSAGNMGTCPDCAKDSSLDELKEGTGKARTITGSGSFDDALPNDAAAAAKAEYQASFDSIKTQMQDMFSISATAPGELPIVTVGTMFNKEITIDWNKWAAALQYVGYTILFAAGVAAVAIFLE